MVRTHSEGVVETGLISGASAAPADPKVPPFYLTRTLPTYTAVRWKYVKHGHSSPPHFQFPMWTLILILVWRGSGMLGTKDSPEFRSLFGNLLLCCGPLSFAELYRFLGLGTLRERWLSSYPSIPSFSRRVHSLGHLQIPTRPGASGIRVVSFTFYPQHRAQWPAEKTFNMYLVYGRDEYACAS